MVLLGHKATSDYNANHINKDNNSGLLCREFDLALDDEESEAAFVCKGLKMLKMLNAHKSQSFLKSLGKWTWGVRGILTPNTHPMLRIAHQLAKPHL